MLETKMGKKVYMAWNDAKRRCYDPTMSCYKSYGAAGVTVQDSWKDDVNSFYNYVSKLPNFKAGMSLDRVNNDLGYSEGNLRWVPQIAQVRNRGRQDNNSSGVTGISFTTNQRGQTSVRARWQTLEGSKSVAKSFSINTYGLLPAFKMACEHREQMIQKLNDQGAGYSDKHGK